SCNGFNKPGVVLGNHDASAELTDYDQLITDWVVGQDTNGCGALNNLTRYGLVTPPSNSLCLKMNSSTVRWPR
ncbi:MAG: hypothetical protein ACKVHX_14765, partial [Alphaproteobacteria bacterium]